MGKAIDRIGQRFGRLVVLSREASGRFGQARWRCRCDCGNETVTDGASLVTGRTSSCGCLKAERSLTINFIHGHSSGGKKSLTYAAWLSMRSRVLNESNDHYKYYGGRGISICDRWSKFQNFLEDMGEVPEGLTIERLDNDGNYCKENCRWATHTRQGRNNRNVKLSMEKARAIRADQRTNEEIAKDYGVCEENIELVKAHKTWKENQRLF